jgi:hypothetical protein
MKNLNVIIDNLKRTMEHFEWCYKEGDITGIRVYGKEIIKITMLLKRELKEKK